MTIPISLLVIHMIADFVLQSDWMALNKSKNNEALTWHVFVYSLCFVPFGLTFALSTFGLHWITDYFTSRVTSKLWFIDLHDPSDCLKSEYEPRFGQFQCYNAAVVKLGLRHWFFVMIGFDQLIHYVTLALTYRWLYGA